MPESEVVDGRRSSCTRKLEGSNSSRYPKRTSVIWETSVHISFHPPQPLTSLLSIDLVVVCIKRKQLLHNDFSSIESVMLLLLSPVLSVLWFHLLL